MTQSLSEIALSLKNADKKVQLIYAFNGTGKTRLSSEFKKLIASKNPETEVEDEGMAARQHHAPVAARR